MQLVNLTVNKIADMYAISIEIGTIGKYVRTLEGHYDRVVTDYQIKTTTIDANISIQALKEKLKAIIESL